ncbi:peptidoglycan-binding protein, partial [Priestia megaterium]
DSINANETLTIPNSISESDKELLARLVQAEAKGEPYAGKVAVATVVLNRVDSDSFPNSIHDVIYQGTQFT